MPCRCEIPCVEAGGLRAGQRSLTTSDTGWSGRQANGLHLPGGCSRSWRSHLRQHWAPLGTKGIHGSHHLQRIIQWHDCTFITLFAQAPADLCTLELVTTLYKRKAWHLATIEEPQ